MLDDVTTNELSEHCNSLPSATGRPTVLPYGLVSVLRMFFNEKL